MVPCDKAFVVIAYAAYPNCEICTWWADLVGVLLSM